MSIDEIEKRDLLKSLDRIICETEIIKSNLNLDTEHICNLCGETCVVGKSPNFDKSSGLINARVSGWYESTPGNGFGALEDCTAYEFSLCEFCLDWLFSKFKIPVTQIDYDCSDEISKWRSASQRVKEDDWRKMKSEFF